MVNPRLLSGYCVHLACMLVLFTACIHKNNSAYKYHHHGYYYKLLAFENDLPDQKKWEVARVGVSFKTMSDSVFWDSYNNLGDNFFVHMDSLYGANTLNKCIQGYTLNDSVSVLLKTKDFFKQQFNASGIPYFSESDSVVVVNFKIKELLSKTAFSKLYDDLEKRELGRIAVYFGSHEDAARAKDSSGFYWVEKPDSSASGTLVKQGDVLKLSYTGSFLNGRFLEQSPPNFELVYGTPDQVFRGINYVIGRIKVGQNAKIILPSRLAFGEKGSSNGTVPPFTPLVYEIKIN